MTVGRVVHLVVAVGTAGAVACGLALLRRVRAGPRRAGPRTLVGVLGGLGPAASALLMRFIVEEAEHGGARTDSEHPPVLIYVAPPLPTSPAACELRRLSLGLEHAARSGLARHPLTAGRRGGG